jgi:uncharacterized membrane protein (UPF0127 family)
LEYAFFDTLACSCGKLALSSAKFLLSAKPSNFACGGLQKAYPFASYKRRMKYFLPAVVGVLVLLGVWFLGAQFAGDQGQDREIVEQRVPTASIHGHVVELEVANTPEKQLQGLSGRESLDENAGMLFPYPTEGTPGFWMPDMHFAIDIIWIDKHKRVVGVEHSVAPETYPAVFRAASPVLYVLEVNAGWAQTHNVSASDEVILDF